jgi:dihydrofolate reductase
MQISIIVAVSTNGVIGKDNQLIWRLPDDLKRFKSLSLGHPIIMGRKTYESIGKPLPGRTSIVITRNPEFFSEGIVVATSLGDAMEKARLTGTPETFIIGGGNIYEQALPVSHKIYLTEVHTEIEGDTFFHLDNPTDWQENVRVHHPADDRHAVSFDFVDLSRK